MAELNTIITLRQGTTDEWSSSDVVLKTGEMGLEYLADGSVKIKAGDGEHLWSELSYVGSDVKAANVFQVELEEGATDDIEAIEEVVSAEGATKQDGDVAIVKATITDGKYSYTSYVYDSALDVEGEDSTHGWSAMDGNYSASNVFLKNGITLAGDYTSIGNYSKGDTIAAGTSLESVLSGLLQQEILPGDTGYAIDLPSASISVSGSSGEVGSSYTLPTATLTITDVGSYPFEPTETGIVFAAGDVKLSGGGSSEVSNDVQFVKNSKLTLKATDTATLYTDTAKSYTFSGSASYQASTVTPKSNLGNEVPNKKIAAGDVAVGGTKTATFTGFRKAFAGGSNATTLDSAVIRAASATKNSFSAMDSQSEALEFTAAAGATKVFFAYPSTWSVGTKKPYFEMFGLAWGENTDIIVKDDIQVADARGTVEDVLQGPIAYKLYCWELDTPLQAESTKFRVWFK